MNTFINYITESGISLGLLSLVYFAFLRNETFFKANRLFLLGAVVFSSLLPFLHLRIIQSGASITLNSTGQGSTMLETVTVYSTNMSGFLSQLINSNMLLVYLYFAVSAVMSFMLIFRISRIAYLVFTNPREHKDGITFVYIEEDSSPYSFLHFLFVSKKNQTHPGWEKMLAHESEHIRQGHTADVLILELISLFQWFNPFFWMLRRVIKENHEYMADRAVLQNGVPVDLYKQVLISQFIGQQFRIANNFNSSLIKSRIKMMTRIKSSKLATLRYLSGIVTILLLLVVFACEKKEVTPEPEAQKGFLNDQGVFISNLDKDPLIIIDEQLADKDAMNKLDPQNIQSINVVKNQDNQFVAQYGEKAKNGVISIQTKEGSNDARKNNIEGISVVSYGSTTPKVESTDPVFNIVEEMPEFPGGDLALRQFIAKTVKYPVSAQESGKQGKVYVNFVVEKDGSVGRVKVVRGVDPALDMEALRVVKSSPKWTPGKQRGEAVAVSYTVPINFMLQ